MPSHVGNDFEQFLLSMIPKQIPKVYLEGYQTLIEQIHKLPWPKSPKLIYTSNLLWHDTVAMAYTAEKVEQGSSLVLGQHGGVYGVGKFTFAEEHEIKISDRYLTWGWSSESNSSVIPIGIVKTTKKVFRSFNYNKNLAFGYIKTSLSKEELTKQKIFIEVGRKKYPASVILKPLNQKNIKSI